MLDIAHHERYNVMVLCHRYYDFGRPSKSRENVLANSDPRGGINNQISENKEEIRVFYCLALKKDRKK